MRCFALVLLTTLACVPRGASAPCNVDEDCLAGICVQGFCATGERPVVEEGVDAGTKRVPDGGVVDLSDAGEDSGVVADAGVADAGAADAGESVDAGGGNDVPLPVHRYPFDVDARDVIGGADGVLMGGAVVALGAVVLDGEEAYVDLPNGIISSQPALSVEAWLVWAGLNNASGVTSYWQRVFDFGTNSAGEIDDVGGGPFSGTDFIQVTPQMTADVLRLTGNHEAGPVIIDAIGPADVGGLTHIAVTFDPDAQVAALYVNGALVGSDAFSLDLQALDDVNNWIGRSNYSNDLSLYGSVTELRIYGEVLSPEDIAASFERGEDDLGL